MELKQLLSRHEKVCENGLRVILFERPGYARSLFMMGIPAGGTSIASIRNGKTANYKTGLAHFLEHQMFRLNGQDVTPLLSLNMARTNAATSYDDTCYFVDTNSDPYKPLELLMEFVQTLDIDEESVEKERGIILSEYQQYDQDPTSRLLKETLRSLYHVYPMREDILGTPRDIQSISVKDLREFYETWYDPASLVLCGVTSRNPQELFEFIEEEQKRYPSAIKGEPARKLLPEEPADPARPFFDLQMDIDQTFVCLGIKLDPVSDPKERVVKDIMLNLYLNSLFSPYNPDFQKWIDSRVIGGLADAEGDLSADHGYILIYAQSEQPETFLQIIEDLLAIRPAMNEEAFEALRRKAKAAAIRMVDSFETLASQSISGAFEGFDPLDEAGLYERLTTEEIDEFIASLDLSRQVKVIVHPQTDPDARHNPEKIEQA